METTVLWGRSASVSWTPKCSHVGLSRKPPSLIQRWEDHITNCALVNYGFRTQAKLVFLPKTVFFLRTNLWIYHWKLQTCIGLWQNANFRYTAVLSIVSSLVTWFISPSSHCLSVPIHLVGVFFITEEINLTLKQAFLLFFTPDVRSCILKACRFMQLPLQLYKPHWTQWNCSGDICIKFQTLKADNKVNLRDALIRPCHDPDDTVVPLVSCECDQGIVSRSK